MQTPFSLRIFVADGLRIVDKSNWIGKALVFPRVLLPQVKARPELAQTGVYLLLGPRPDGEGDMLCVGDPIRPRLESHYAQKDFWTRAIGFITREKGKRVFPLVDQALGITRRRCLGSGHALAWRVFGLRGLSHVNPENLKNPI